MDSFWWIVLAGAYIGVGIVMILILTYPKNIDGPYVPSYPKNVFVYVTWGERAFVALLWPVIFGSILVWFAWDILKLLLAKR